MNQIIRQLEARLSESNAFNAQQQQRHSESVQQQLQQQQHHHAQEVRVLQQKLDAATAAAASSSLEAQTARAQVADMDAKASDARHIHSLCMMQSACPKQNPNAVLPQHRLTHPTAAGADSFQRSVARAAGGSVGKGTAAGV